MILNCQVQFEFRSFMLINYSQTSQQLQLFTLTLNTNAYITLLIFLFYFIS